MQKIDHRFRENANRSAFRVIGAKHSHKRRLIERIRRGRKRERDAGRREIGDREEMRARGVWVKEEKNATTTCASNKIKTIIIFIDFYCAAI